MVQRLLCLLALALCAAQVNAATRVDLNRGWQVFREAKPDAVHTPVPIPDAAEHVDVPHSWNRAGANYDYLGGMWYFKAFDLPKLPADSIAQLHFGGTFYKARVFVNSKEVGAHEGGFHEYSFDVTSQLRSHNVIAVLIDNRPGMMTIPGFGARGAPDAWYDWWAYGGIVRDVWLELHGGIRIERQTIRAKIEGESARVSNRIVLHSRGGHETSLAATLVDPRGKTLIQRRLDVTLVEGRNEATVDFWLEKIQRWNLDTPNLYTVRIHVADGNKQASAAASETFGLRTVEIRDRHLLINGHRVRLTGMTRHADSPWEGMAETRGTLLHDWEDMKSLNMTLTRPVHYAPDPQAADFADRRGILMIPEIPIWQASEQQLSNPEYLALAKTQMRELIEQYGNHPSVFAWSVLNESAAGTPGGIRFFREMRDYIRSIDPDRFVTLADDNLPKLARAEDSAANDADFLMMNQYFGAWHGPREALEPALDKVDRLFPTKMVIISELGYPGIFAKNPADADPMRVSILREQFPLLARRDWIAGAILWCYQDYKSRRYFWPGQEQGYLEHGIVDQNRQRKPSYFAWAELNTPATLDLQWSRSANGVPTDFTLRLSPNSSAQMPYFPLTGYTVSWQFIGAENRAYASGGFKVEAQSEARVAASVPEPGKHPRFRLVAKLLRPDGTVAMERALASQ